jgi:hypothetical protein
MKLIYRKDTGEVKMTTDGNIEYDHNIFSEKIITPNADEKDKIKQNWKGKIKDSKLILEKSDNIISKEKSDRRITLKDDLEKATTIKELKQIILELI